MGKRRDQIRMSDAELWDFIESQKKVKVAKIGRSGAQNLVTLWLAIEDGAIVMETFTKSQKVRNLQRDPRITLLFEDGAVYDELRGASMTSEAELISETDRVHALHTKVLLRNTPDLPREILEEASRKMAPKKTAILVRPREVMSWDHRKLGGLY